MENKSIGVGFDSISSIYNSNLDDCYPIAYNGQRLCAGVAIVFRLPVADAD
ncbi:MAG: hypothetical protein QM763_12860 [Agriterribacter sp.]